MEVMVGGISAMSPYVHTSYRYMGYGRMNQTPQEIGADSGRKVGAVSGVRSADAVSGTQGRQSISAIGGAQGVQNAGAVYGVQANAKVGAALAAGRAASPGTPVEPVSPVPAVEANAPRGIGYMIPFLREGMDPAELAGRTRIQYVGPTASGKTPASGGDGSEAGAESAGLGVDAVRKTAEEGECQTCKERKYQDGSDDAGVSYKTPTRIAPEQAATAVRGHEMEHVVRERAAAVREDRQVVSQSVTIHTAICPECGTVYVSGGTTRTTTAANPEAKQPEQQEGNGGFDAA